MKNLYESILSEAQLTESIFSVSPIKSAATNAKKVATKALKEQNAKKIADLAAKGAVTIYNKSGKMMTSDTIAKKGAIIDNTLYIPDAGKGTANIRFDLNKISNIIPDIDTISLCGRYGANGPIAGTAEKGAIRLYCGDGYDGRGKINKIISNSPIPYMALKRDNSFHSGSMIPAFKNLDLSEAISTRNNDIYFENIFAENIILPRTTYRLHFSKIYDPTHDIRLGKNIIGSASYIDITYQIFDKDDILSLYKILFDTDISEKDLDDINEFTRYTLKLTIRPDLYKYIGIDKIKSRNIFIRIEVRWMDNSFFMIIDNHNGKPHILQCSSR